MDISKVPTQWLKALFKNKFPSKTNFFYTKPWSLQQKLSKTNGLHILTRKLSGETNIYANPVHKQFCNPHPPLPKQKKWESQLEFEFWQTYGQSIQHTQGPALTFTTHQHIWMTDNSILHYTRQQHVRDTHFYIVQQKWTSFCTGQ